METKVIGYIHTPFKEKFGIPRQPGLAPAAKGVIIMEPDYNDIHAFRGIESFSHLWLIFQFHQVESGKWRPLVRPPRLGGNEKIGVFATRSTHRPSNMGLSVVKLDSVVVNKNQVNVHVSGVDLLNGTPILDIKPYVHYSDHIAQATSGFATEAPTAFPVEFTETAQAQLQPILQEIPHFQDLVIQTLCYQPAPAYHRKLPTASSLSSADEPVVQPLREYGVLLYRYNVIWTQSNVITVCRIELR